MFGKTLTHTRAQDFKIGSHVVRVCICLDGKGGMYAPHLSLHLKGPNGSVSGFGPKGWPKFMWRMFPYYDRTPGKWSSVVHIPLPHVSWRIALRTRKIGGLKLYKVISNAYRSAL